MSDWYGPKRQIKAIRKAAMCNQCSTLIMPGEPAVNHVGVYDGDFFSNHTHVDCDELSFWVAGLWDAWGEDFPFLDEMDWSYLSPAELDTVKERWPRLFERYASHHQHGEE